MTKAKSFDVLDCEQSNVNHGHGYFQQIVVWWTMLVEPFDIVIRVGHLAECGSCAVWRHDVENWWQLRTNYSKLNIETIPSDGQHREWINGIVIALALPNWGWYAFFGRDPKPIAGSNAMVLVGKWMVWAKKMNPNAHQDTIRKLFSTPFYWCKKHGGSYKNSYKTSR